MSTKATAGVPDGPMRDWLSQVVLYSGSCITRFHALQLVKSEKSWKATAQVVAAKPCPPGTKAEPLQEAFEKQPAFPGWETTIKSDRNPRDAD